MVLINALSCSLLLLVLVIQRETDFIKEKEDEAYDNDEIL